MQQNVLPNSPVRHALPHRHNHSSANSQKRRFPPQTRSPNRRTKYLCTDKRAPAKCVTSARQRGSPINKLRNLRTPIFRLSPGRTSPPPPQPFAAPAGIRKAARTRPPPFILPLSCVSPPPAAASPFRVGGDGPPAGGRVNFYFWNMGHP